MLYQGKETDLAASLSKAMRETAEPELECMRALKRFGLLNEWGLKALREMECPVAVAPVDARDAV